MSKPDDVEINVQIKDDGKNGERIKKEQIE